MPFEDFRTYVEQALRFGYRAFNLTPILGEPLTDPFFSQRLDHLDQSQTVDDYGFCTNLIDADDSFLRAVGRLRKLRWLSVSIYGHDQDSFCAVTGGDARQYGRLLTSLAALGDRGELLPRVDLKIRTAMPFDLERCATDLGRMVKHLRERGARVRLASGVSNWSGLVDAPALERLPLATRTVPRTRTEPCAFLFKPVILPDGRVNACPVGDGNATLDLGSVRPHGLFPVLSSANGRYLDLIRAHLRSDFPPVCRGCTAHRGISETGFSYQFHRRPQVTMNELLAWLDENAGRMADR
jgi:hypothetical protein